MIETRRYWNTQVTAPFTHCIDALSTLWTTITTTTTTPLRTVCFVLESAFWVGLSLLCWPVSEGGERGGGGGIEDGSGWQDLLCLFISSSRWGNVRKLRRGGEDRTRPWGKQQQLGDKRKLLIWGEHFCVTEEKSTTLAGEKEEIREKISANRGQNTFHSLEKEIRC